MDGPSTPPPIHKKIRHKNNFNTITAAKENLRKIKNKTNLNNEENEINELHHPTTFRPVTRKNSKQTLIKKYSIHNNNNIKKNTIIISPKSSHINESPETPPASQPKLTPPLNKLQAFMKNTSNRNYNNGITSTINKHSITPKSKKNSNIQLNNNNNTINQNEINTTTVPTNSSNETNKKNMKSKLLNFVSKKKSTSTIINKNIITNSNIITESLSPLSPVSPISSPVIKKYLNNNKYNANDNNNKNIQLENKKDNNIEGNSYILDRKERRRKRKINVHNHNNNKSSSFIPFKPNNIFTKHDLYSKHIHMYMINKNKMNNTNKNNNKSRFFTRSNKKNNNNNIKFSLENKRKLFLQEQLEIKRQEMLLNNNNNNNTNDSNETIQLVPGMACYVPDNDNMWLVGKIDKYDEKKKKVYVYINNNFDNESEDIENRIIDLNDPKIIEAIAGPSATNVDYLPLANDTNINNDDETKEDLQLLKYLNEPSILYNIRKRFLASQPYTYSNNIIIAINPYQWLDELYSNKIKKSYLNNYNKNKDLLPPHVYFTSTNAYKTMIYDKKYQNQSILVSGESGAGKTETTKILMNHLASISDNNDQDKITISRIVQVNPLLESFGNAKTVRNDNSSRFGKFTQMQFNNKGILIGAKCETYLLEKSRVVSIEKGERNYHIFYQLIMGLSKQDKEEYHLNKHKIYRYLGDKNIMNNDTKLFEKTKIALELIGLNNDISYILFQILAGILHLGQLDFIKDDEVENGSTIDNLDQLESVGIMLGLPEDFILKCLCSRTVKARNDEYNVPLNPYEARQNCDALAKAIYSKLFEWMVIQINNAISADHSNINDKVHGQIGVLDIFGFEHFQHNGFEQFCINYANEKLQEKFTHDVFKSVEEEYIKEEINIKHISYKDNKKICELIESKMGIIALLNDHIRQPKNTEESLVNKMKTNYNKNYQNIISFPKVKRTQFTITHYAGHVTYETIGFMEKHIDTLSIDLLELIKSSSIDLLHDLFYNENDDNNESDDENSSNIKIIKKSKHSKNKITVGTQFKNSLILLMDNIKTTKVHYIRCIKPNKNKDSQLFDNKMVCEQLKSAGVIEAIRISRAGYPNRILPNELIHKYSFMFPPSLIENNKNNIKKTCDILLKTIGKKSPNDYQIGKNIIYFKNGMMEELEIMKSDFYYYEATTIQKIILGFLERWRYFKMIQNSIKIQSIVRKNIIQNEFIRTIDSIIIIQSIIRGFLAKLYVEKLAEKRLKTIVSSSLSSIQSGKNVIKPYDKNHINDIKIKTNISTNQLNRPSSSPSSSVSTTSSAYSNDEDGPQFANKTKKNISKKLSIKNNHYDHNIKDKKSMNEPIISKTISVSSLKKENIQLRNEVEDLRDELERLREECERWRDGVLTGTVKLINKKKSFY